MGFELQAGAIFAELDLDPSKFQQAVNTVLQSAQEFAKKTQDILDTVGNKPTLFQGIKNGASQIVGSVKTAFGTMGTVIKGIAAPISYIEGKIFSLKTALTAFAGYQFFNRAADVEKMAIGFDTLTKSIGATSDTLLSKLRTALGGAISDMEIMRITNRAVLQGVVQSEEGFVKLAEAANTLGDTVGISGSAALEKLVETLGYGQTKGLKELNLQVDQDEALAKYKLQIGALGRELTESERKAAIFAAVLAEVDGKLKTLSGATSPTLSGFEKLRASLTNTIDRIAVAVSGPFSKIAESLARFLEENKAKIVAFAKFVRTIIEFLFDEVGRIFQQWTSGGTTFGGALGRITATVVEVLAALVNLGVKALDINLKAAIPVVIQNLTDFFKQVIEGFKGSASELWDDLNWWVYENFFEGYDLEEWILSDWVNEAKKRRTQRVMASWMPQDRRGAGAAAGGLVDSDTEKQLSSAVQSFWSKVFPSSSKSDAENTLAARFQDTLNNAIAKFRVDAGLEVAQTKITDLWTGIKNVFNKVGDKVSGEFDFVKTIFGFGGKSKADQRVSEALAALDPFLQKIKALKSETAGGVGMSVVEREMIAFEEAVEKFKDAPDKVREVIEKTREQLRSGLEGRAALDAFTKMEDVLKQVEDEAIRAQSEVAAIGGNEVQARVDEVNARLAALRKEFEQYLDNPKFLDFWTKIEEKFKAIAAAPVDAKLRQIRLEISDAITQTNLELSKIGRTTTNQALLDLSADVQNQRKKGTLSESELTQYEAARTAQIYEKELREITAELAGTISDSFIGGITDAFMKGERLSKAWTNIVGGFFQQALQNAVQRATAFVTDQLTVAMNKLGSAIGLGAGLGGVAAGLIAIGGAIWQSFQSKKSATIDDFSTAINSSEAVRGVVAGPTNVPISKVGESLKSALRTTEILLGRLVEIAERGTIGALGATGGSGVKNAIYPLTAATVG